MKFNVNTSEITNTKRYREEMEKCEDAAKVLPMWPFRKEYFFINFILFNEYPRTGVFVFIS